VNENPLNREYDNRLQNCSPGGFFIEITIKRDLCPGNSCQLYPAGNQTSLTIILPPPAK
jgi:hypothetical protein